MKATFKPLSELIGGRVRELRQRADLQQETIAAEARRLGFDWVRGTVAMIEAGRRRLTLEEFLCLPQILENVGAGVLWLEDLLPGEGTALLTPLIVTAAYGLRAMLRGDSRLGRDSVLAGPVRDVPDAPGTDEVQKLWRKAWPKGMPDKGTVYRVALASRGDPEIKVARTLGVSPATVALAAESRWGHSLSEEREARAARMGAGLAPRALQALRGVITRDLREELRPLMKGVTKKQTRRRTR